MPRYPSNGGNGNGNGNGGVGRGMGFSAGQYGNKPVVLEKTKAISYNAVSDQVYSLSTAVSASAPSGVLPNAIELRNTGGVPLNVLAGFETYSTETAETGATKYLHVMLMPGERRAVELKTNWEGNEVVDSIVK